MKKSTILISIMLLIIFPSIYATQSSDEYLECLSEILYDDCEEIFTCGAYMNGEIPCNNELKPLTKQSIFNWLKNNETMFVNPNQFFPSQYMLRCVTSDDAPLLRRNGFEEYTLDTEPMSCPKRVEENYNFIQIGVINFLNQGNFYITLEITLTLSIALNIYFMLRYLRKKRGK